MRVLVHIPRAHRPPRQRRCCVQGREDEADAGADQRRPADHVTRRGRAQEPAAVRERIPADVKVRVDDHCAATSTARPAASTGASPPISATQKVAPSAAASSTDVGDKRWRPWTLQPPDSSLITGTEAIPSSGTASSEAAASEANRMSGRMPANSYATYGPPCSRIQPTPPSSSARRAPSRLAASTVTRNSAFLGESTSSCACRYTSAAPDQPPSRVGAAWVACPPRRLVHRQNSASSPS